MADHEDAAGLIEELASGRYGLGAGGFRLDGRTVVVTGASQNIGLSLALGFAEAGADVLMVARNAERLERAVQAVRATVPERRIAACPADVGEVDGIGRIAATVAEEFGVADVLVNNAPATGRDGVPAGIDILDLPDSSWETTYRTNVLGAFRLIRALFAGQSTQNRDPSVINVLSGSGFQPVPEPRSVAYGASKSALWMMTRYLAHHLAPSIRVNAVCPGAVTADGEPATQLTRDLLHEIPMGRLGTPNEIAGAAVYLASPAASYTTGEVIFCNGGRPW